MKLLVIVASVRESRKGTVVADWYVNGVKKDGRFEVEVADLKTLDLPYVLPEKHPSQVEDGQYDNEKVTAWAKQIKSADAIAIISPEYNHGYPASLKNAFDHIYHEWVGKPATFINYGAAGGAYAYAAFQFVAAYVKLDVTNQRIAISEIWSAFNEDGTIVHEAYYQPQVVAGLNALAAKIESN